MQTKFERAAKDHGWRMSPLTPGIFKNYRFLPEDGGYQIVAKCWEQLCEFEGIDADEWRERNAWLIHAYELDRRDYP